MHRKLLYILISLLLTSCVATPDTNAPTLPASTLTPLSLPSFTAAPSPSPIPPTVDLNMPDGATGKDTVTGLYTKTTEDGKTTLYWEPITFGKDVEKGVTGHWFETRMKDGKNIMLYDDNLVSGGKWGGDTIPFSQLIIYKHTILKAAYVLSHPDQTADFGPGTELNSQSFSAQLLGFLGVRYFHKTSADITQQDWQGFDQAKHDGSLSLPAGGDIWILSKGYRELIVDAPDSSFQKTDNYYWKRIIIDHQLVVLIAPPESNKLSDQDMRIMTFAPMLEVILHDPDTGQKVTSFYGGPTHPQAAEYSQLGGSNFTYTNVKEKPTTVFIEIDYSK